MKPFNISICGVGAHDIPLNGPATVFVPKTLREVVEYITKSRLNKFTVTVNGKPQSGAYLMKPGDRVVLFSKSFRLTDMGDAIFANIPNRVRKTPHIVGGMVAFKI